MCRSAMEAAAGASNQQRYGQRLAFESWKVLLQFKRWIPLSMIQMIIPYCISVRIGPRAEAPLSDVGFKHDSLVRRRFYSGG